jgi:hypothetical protein
MQKSDWKTAKSELQKSDALTPGKSIVHLDLAIVESNLGDAAAAKAELAEAWRLGLPTDQKKAAQDLDNKLLALSQTQKPPKKEQTFATGEEYYKAKNSGTRYVALLFPQQNVELLFMNFWSGEKPNLNRLQTVALGFIPMSGTPETMWFKQEAVFVLDGRQMHIPSGDSSSATHQIPYYLLEDISLANSAEARIDGVQLSFLPEQIAELRKFVTQVAPNLVWRQTVDVAGLNHLDSSAALQNLASLINASTKDVPLHLSYAFPVMVIQESPHAEGPLRHAYDTEPLNFNDLTLIDGNRLSCRNFQECVIRELRYADRTGSGERSQKHPTDMVGAIFVGFHDDMQRRAVDHALFYLWYRDTYGGP